MGDDKAPVPMPEMSWHTATMVDDHGRRWAALVLTIPLAPGSASALAAGLETAARMARSGLEVVGTIGSPEPNRAQRRRAERGDGERGNQG